MMRFVLAKMISPSWLALLICLTSCSTVSQNLGSTDQPTVQSLFDRTDLWVDQAQAITLDSYDSSRALVFMVYGQSNSASYGERGYFVTKPVFMMHRGEAYRYRDPAVGATGRGGSVWGMVGDQLIDRTDTSEVYFSLSGFGNKSIAELTRGPFLDYFKTQLQMTKNTLGKIDGILIFHGESNHKARSGSSDYARDFKLLEKEIRTISSAPIFLSQTSYCGDEESDSQLLEIQEDLAINMKGVMRGPNTDQLIDSRFRGPDKCHFSKEGFKELAELWVFSILNASEI